MNPKKVSSFAKVLDGEINGKMVKIKRWDNRGFLRIFDDKIEKREIPSAS